MAYFTHLVIGLLLLSFVLSYANLRWENPLLGIFNRWLRWISFTLVVASLATELEWTDRPYWLVAVTAFFGWFLLETVYYWFLIAAFSRSPIPIFPRFRSNEGGDEWPAQKQYILIRDWLRSQGFKKLLSVKAELREDLAIRSTVYQEQNGESRVQVLFFPQRAGSVSVCYVISTQTQDGLRYVTDNVFMPFGGYYPENWYLVRRPLKRQLEKLVKYHRERLRRDEVVVVPWDSNDNILEELNQQQRMLEQINLKQGFLLPHELQEDYGRITSEGRYRLWKEIWLLNYLGITVRY